MAAKGRRDSGEATVKQRPPVTNWSEYDRLLVNRRNLTVWFDDASINGNWTPVRPVGRAKPGMYSETAILPCLTIKALFQLPYRATKGLIKSLTRLCQLDLPVPDHSYMSRRASEISVKASRRQRKGQTHVVELTGLKIFGEGELAEMALREAPLYAAIAGCLCKTNRWTVRQHGVGKRRTWRKIHLAADETSKDIISIEVITADWGDGEVFPGLLDQAAGEKSLKCPSIAPKAVMPPLPSGTPELLPFPRRTAQFPANTTIPVTPSSTTSTPRVAPAGRTIAATTRSIAENMMYRLKQLGHSLYSRTPERQMTEAHIRATIINTFTYVVGMPQSVLVGQLAKCDIGAA